MCPSISSDSPSIGQGMAEVPKRQQKTITSFFKTTTKAESSLFELTVPGLSIVKDFISEEEEKQLLFFFSTQKWRTDLQRRVIHYGGSYCLLPPRHVSAEEKQRIENDIIVASPMPLALDFLITRMIEQKFYFEEATPQYCIVNEYTANQGISAHIENFKFGEPVCGLTMGNGDWMRFHELVRPNDGSVRSGKAAKAERTGRKEDIWLPPRSLLVMRRDARSNWQHEICRSMRGRIDGWKRTSLTFRVDAITR